MGLITGVMIVVQTRLGNIWTRHGKVNYRYEEPKSFYTSIILQVLFVAIFFGMAIYQYAHPKPAGPTQTAHVQSAQ